MEEGDWRAAGQDGAGELSDCRGADGNGAGRGEVEGEGPDTEEVGLTGVDGTGRSGIVREIGWWCNGNISGDAENEEWGTGV